MQKLMEGLEARNFGQPQVGPFILYNKDMFFVCGCMLFRPSKDNMFL